MKLFLCGRHKPELVRLLCHGKNHVWGVSCQRSPSVTVSFIDCNEITTCDTVKKQLKSICRDLINTLSSPIDHSVSILKKKQMSRISPSFLVDSSFLVVCFWELGIFTYSVLILWWDWFLINFRISAQVIFQCDCSAIIRASGHRSITSWTVKLKTPIWGVSQTLGLRQLVRVVFLCQFVRFCTFSFVPSKFFLWFAISRTSQKSFQNSCVIFVLCIFLLSTLFPCVVSLVRVDLFFRFSMSNSVRKSLLNHVVRNR